MTYNPERMAPKKYDVSKLKEGLSYEQQKKIYYEAALLRIAPQDLLYLAPHLFCEARTAANTAVILEDEDDYPTMYGYANHGYSDGD